MRSVDDYVGRIKYQEDFINNSWWNTSCNFLEVLRAVELKVGTLYSPGEVEDMVNDLIAQGAISRHAGLHSSDSYNTLGIYLGKLTSRKIKVTQIGFVDANNTPRSWDNTKKPQFDFIQLKWKATNSRGKPIDHWTLADDEGVEIYDSFQGDLKKDYVAKRYLLNIEVT